MPIDTVISADTGMEFPEMYEHLAKVDDYLFRERACTSPGSAIQWALSG